VVDPDPVPVDAAKNRELVELTDVAAALFTAGRRVLKVWLVGWISWDRDGRGPEDTLSVDSRVLGGPVRVFNCPPVTRVFMEDALAKIDGMMSIVFFVTESGWHEEPVERMPSIGLIQHAGEQTACEAKRATQ
jgi:hypothetical protein